MKIWRFAVISIISALLTCTMPKTTEKNMYGFTVQNWRAKALEVAMNLTHLGQRFTLKEDSFVYDEQRKIACVADGITRDFLDGSVVTHDLKGVMKFLNEQYPSPSPAREAADICTKSFMETKSFRQANGLIGEYNHEKGLLETNYLNRDLAGCTAAGFWEEKGLIHWTFIADSRIAIIDKNGMRFKTPDQGPHSEGRSLYLESRVQENGGWSNSKARRAIRKDYRNNPEDNYFSFGVLTGEETAIPYINDGKEKLDIGDYILAFTDGMADIIFNGNEPNPNFIDILKNNPPKLEKFCRGKVNTEGTLVVYKVE